MLLCSLHMSEDTLKSLAEKNIHDIVRIAIEHTDDRKALVVYDTETELTQILTSAYRKVLPEATFIDFNSVAKEEIISAFDALSPCDLVVLIQSTDFRLNEFRIRIHLFQKKLKVIDHQHLTRNEPDQWSTYIHALAYDTQWYRGIGKRLKQKLMNTETLRVQCKNTELVVTGGLEEPKLNIGDYTGMENIGGTFPIGEVFTEAIDLTKTNGSIMVYAYAGANYHIDMHAPFQIDIENGIVVGFGNGTPQSFIDIISQIKTNERAIVREIGFGLNRAMTSEHYLNDITAFERILGMHFSLGEKHTVYKKQGITPDKTRYHVDIFPKITKVYSNDTCIFDNGTYVV